MQIITISGLDGSGKSTQIEMLKNHLESQERRVFYFHAIKFGIANKIKFFLKNPYNTFYRPEKDVIEENNKKSVFLRRPSEENTENYKERSVMKSGKLGMILRKIFLKIDVWRFNLLRNKLSNNGVDYILSDRYFYDSVVNIEYLEFPSLTPTLSQKERGILKPAIAIYLQTDPEIIMQRERKPDQGIGYLRKKKEIFDKYAAEWNLKIIDGNSPKEEIFEEIKNLIVYENK